MAHKLGSMYHVPHGLANALLICHVIKYNSTDNPTKQGLLPQYRYPFVKGRYANISDMLGFGKDCEQHNTALNQRFVDPLGRHIAAQNIHHNPLRCFAKT